MRNAINEMSPKIADRILSSLIRLKIGVKFGIPGTRYQIQRFGSCPGIPSCFLSAILGFPFFLDKVSEIIYENMFIS
jgi:hypothetical protein